MGRGRAKAKQTKVARQLKYSGGATDLDRLRSELGVNESQRNGAEDRGDLDDPYAAWADQDEDEDEEDDEDGDPYRSAGGNGSRDTNGYHSN
jgi:Protein of unknown function (DUF3073)